MSNKKYKLLILGGASVHVKLVAAAKKMGIYTIVTDYISYEYSPAKKMADEAWQIDIYDVDALVDLCVENKVDGVISSHLDPCQMPYLQLCKRMNYYCYGDSSQFDFMTNKINFKRFCIENGVGTIQSFSTLDVKERNVVFPVIVKPSDSRGSRGQAICWNYEELDRAIIVAQENSSDNCFILERYYQNAHEFQVTYFVIDGTPYLIRTADSMVGSGEKKLNRLVSCSVSPSMYTELYLRKTDDLVKKMIKSLDYKFGPIFFQGIEDGGEFMFFDPGLRFPGVDYEIIIEKIFGLNLLEDLVNYALFGDSIHKTIPKDIYNIKGNMVAILFPTVKGGVVHHYEGISSIEKNSSVFSFQMRANPGFEIKWTYDVNQRSAEIDICASDKDQLKKEIETVQKEFRPVDESGHDMTLEYFNVDRIL